ncbi:MAG: hypothetical protein K2Q10_02950, partial [Rhodospirillales bacterium]|nr:hypothetical protein [Rhodospirillales bacterium]
SKRGTAPLDSVAVAADADANGNGAVAVDVVVVTEPKLEEELGKMPARDWFARRAQLRRDHPNVLVVHSWELVPGQSTRAADLDNPANALATFVYAGYAGSGDHRLRADPDISALRILLRDKDFVLQP